MPLKVSDNSEKVKATVIEGMNVGLTAAAVTLQGRMKRNFGSEGGRVIGKTHTGKNIYGSAPVGRFPGIRSGKLRQSVYATRATAGKATVGTNLKYGKWLENGTKYMGARPWLRRSASLAASAMRDAFTSRSREYISAKLSALGGAR